MSIAAHVFSPPASAAVGDPAATRTVYVTVIVLLVLGVALVALAVWLFRRTRPEPQLLAPLEEMDTRAWRKQDPAGQRRALDASRPLGARPVRREAAEPIVDTEFAADRPVVSFDDLAERPAPPAGAPDDPVAPDDPARDDVAPDDAPPEDAENVDAVADDSVSVDTVDTDTEHVDNGNADAEHADTEHVDTENADAENVDTENADAENADTVDPDDETSSAADDGLGSDTATVTEPEERTEGQRATDDTQPVALGRRLLRRPRRS